MKGKDLIGRKVKIVADTCGHQLPVGTIVEITRCNPNSCGYNYNIKNKCCSIKDTDFVVYKLSKEDLEADIAKLEVRKTLTDRKIKKIKNKIEFMKDNEVQFFDIDTWKAFKVLKTINKDTTDLEKATIIAKILRSK